MEFCQVLEHMPIFITAYLPPPQPPDPREKHCQDNHLTVSKQDRESQEKGYLVGFAIKCCPGEPDRLHSAAELPWPTEQHAASIAGTHLCFSLPGLHFRASKARVTKVLSVHNHEVHALNT